MKSTAISYKKIVPCTDANIMASYFAYVMRFFSYYFFYFRFMFSPIKEV